MSKIIPQTKVCKECKKVKPLIDFYKQINPNSGNIWYNPKCKICCIKIATSPVQMEKQKIYQKENIKERSEYRYKWGRKYPLKTIIASAKKRAKKLGIDFDITENDLHVPKYCPYLGVEIELSVYQGNGKGRIRTNSASLDRIDPSKGYVRGNIQIISHLANRMKSNANQEQLITFSKSVLRILNVS